MSEFQPSVPASGEKRRASENTEPKDSTSTRTANEPAFHHHVVLTDKSGTFNVWVQGNLEDVHKEDGTKCVFLTCHDIGNNHHSFRKLFSNPNFQEIRQHAVFVHVDLPGQEDGAEDLADDSPFPKIQALGEDLVTVLDLLQIKCCIGIGDGAGANIIIRFAIMHVKRCLGVILLHPTANASTMIESFKDRFSKWKVEHSAENIVAFRKFGHKLEDTEDQEKAFEDYKEKLKHKVNAKNMTKFTHVFHKRTDIVPNLKDGLKCDALLVVGTRSSSLHAAEYMHSHMNKSRTSMLKVDGVGDVMEESPGKLAYSILLFCKGLGWLSSLSLPGTNRQSLRRGQSFQRQRSLSMEEYDKPNIRRLASSPRE